jgi:rod shape-determining protein MreB
VLCVPSGITDVERRAVDEATRVRRRAHGLPDRGADGRGDRRGLPVADAVASMVIDVGGGTTEVAVISLGGMVVWESIRVGGYEMDDAIVDSRQEHAQAADRPGDREAAKIEIGSVSPDDDGGETTVAGRDLVTGLLRRVTVSAPTVRRALEAPVGRIVAAVKDTLERTPPELAGRPRRPRDRARRRRLAAARLDEKLRDEVGLPVQVAESPLTCVVRGRRPQPRRARDARPCGEGPAQEPLPGAS